MHMQNSYFAQVSEKITTNANVSFETSLTHSQYLKILKSKNDLLNYMSIEDKYKIIINNYTKLENHVFNFALKNMIYTHRRYNETHPDMEEFNTLLMNLLNSAKNYIDQTPQHIHKILDKSDAEYNAFAEKFAPSVYDSNIGYRILTALRNHTQHVDFPIHRIEVELVKSTDENGLDKFTHSTKLVTRLSTIDIKKIVAKEILDTYGEDFDLVPLVRKYITGMATLHNKTRKLIQPAYKNILKALDSIIFKGKIAGPELHNQQLVIVGDTNKTQFPIDCLLHITDIIRTLRSDFTIENHNIIFNKS